MASDVAIITSRAVGDMPERKLVMLQDAQTKTIKQITFFAYDRVEIEFTDGLIVSIKETQQAGDIQVEFELPEGVTNGAH